MSTSDLTIDTDEGTVIMASWDDGDNATWEGTLYAVNSAGSTMTSVGQIDLTNTSYAVMWEELTYLNHVDVPITIEPSAHRPAVTTGAGKEFIKDLIICWTGCMLSSVSCVYAGPLAPECFALVFVACEAGCPIVVLLKKI